MFGIDLETQPEIVQTAAGYAIQGWEIAASWLLSPAAWSQFGLLVVAYFAAVLVSRRLSPVLEKLLNPGDSTNIFASPRRFVMQFLPLLLPLLAYMFTGIGEGIVRSLFDSGAVIAFGKRVFLFLAVRVLVGDIITDPFLKTIGKFVFVPIAALYALGLLDLAQAQLTGTEVAIGNIKFSVMAIVRGLIAGSLLFWLGGWSNKQSTSFISKQHEMRPSLRQLVSKTIEFMIFGLAFLLLMNIMGINLSALAVLGGAIGVGLGFGLQKIASNFISGIILLVEGQATVGDYVELDGGEAGTIVKMTARAAILETFDGRWIVVPNEGSSQRVWSTILIVDQPTVMMRRFRSVMTPTLTLSQLLLRPLLQSTQTFWTSLIRLIVNCWDLAIVVSILLSSFGSTVSMTDNTNTNPKCCLSFGMH